MAVGVLALQGSFKEHIVGELDSNVSYINFDEHMNTFDCTEFFQRWKCET